jgi:hypothetical protein
VSTKSKAGHLVGKTFGLWFVISYKGRGVYQCRCRCGTEKPVYGSNLTQKKTGSCGCVPFPTRKAWNFKDLSGKKFGFLEVQKLDHVEKNRVFWKCLCVCGRILPVSTNNLSRTTSCGCRRYANLLEPKEFLSGRVYREYKTSAKSRGLKWGLEKELFLSLIFQPCHYCGAPPSNEAVTRRLYNNGKLPYNGIDRKDIHKGYIPGNVVPCCRICNWAKQQLSYEEFLNHIRKMAVHLSILSQEE